MPFLIFSSLGQAANLRVISLKPNITRTLMALDAGDEIVGITKFCPKPNATAVVVADYVSADVEAIIRLKPDIVIGSMENSQKRQYETLRTAGIRVELLPSATWDDVVQSIARLGDLIDKKTEAQNLITQSNAQLDLLKTQIATWPKKKFAVFVQRKPLMIAAGHTFIGSLLERIGLKNVFAKNTIPYPVLDDEAILRANPDYLFDMTFGETVSESDWHRPVIRLDGNEFSAAPQSVSELRKIVSKIDQNQ